MRWLLHRLISRFEHRFDYDAAYMHEIATASPLAFLRFWFAQGMGMQSAGLPATARFAARLAAARHEDCGTCAQLVIDMALAESIPAPELRAIVERDFGRMHPDAALATRYAEAVLLQTDCGEFEADLERRFGDAGRVSLAYAIAWTRVYPTLKRALGHARSCRRLSVAGIAVDVRDVTA